MRGLFRACAALAVMWPGWVRAEDSIIKNPGDHPTYTFEAEPHVLLGFGPFSKDGAVGLGFRGTFIIVQNGFVSSINNNVGIGVGGDFFPGKSGVLDVPVVMQWNFFLSTHWTVFGEPGLGFAFGGRAVPHPVFAAGGRYYFSERIALTMRLGYPGAAQVGVSFLF